MKIQTRVDRDNRPDTVERDSFSSKVDERGVGNIHGLKTADRTQRVKTTSSPHIGGKGNKRKRKKRAKAAEMREVQSESENIKSDKPENALQTAVGSGVSTSSENSSSGSSGSARLPPRNRLAKENKQSPKTQKYNSAKTDSDGSAAIEMVQAVQTVCGAAVQAGGILRTAVKTGASGLGSIKTFVQRGVNVGSVRDVGRIATAVNTTVGNAAKSTGQQMLRTKIDKSTITDTGTETIKQGLTELRYADNARKAVVNTACGISKLRAKPRKSKHVNQPLIRKNSKKAARKAAANMRKMIFSKAGLIVLSAAAAIMLVVVIVNGFLTTVISVVNSLFSWLAPPDNEPDKTEIETIQGYGVQVVDYIDEKQSEINDIVDNFVCDKRSYPPYSEISELNQFGNREINIGNQREILAVVAVKKYRELCSDDENTELNFTENDISETVERFYDFEYSYSYGHCGPPYCKEREVKTVHNKGQENEYTEIHTEYYCDVDHKRLYGGVVNKSIDEVFASYDFDEEEEDLYGVYLEEIDDMLGGG